MNRLACACAMALAACAHPTNRELAQLRTVATFAFDAVIDSTRASTSPGLPASSHTIAVTVRDALLCPVEVGQYSGEKLTVYVDDANELKVGSRWWFFAGAWIMGDNLAVHEVARYRAPDADSTIARHFLGPRGTAALLQERVQLSAAIVTTSVVIDAEQIFAKFMQQSPSSWFGVTVPVRGVLSGFVKAGDSLRVALPLSAIGTWPMITGGHRAMPLLLMLESTRDVAQDLLLGETKPFYMIRESGGVRAASDSAMVAELVQRVTSSEAKKPVADWLPHCGRLLSR